jgi:hypothetical protein
MKLFMVLSFLTAFAEGRPLTLTVEPDPEKEIIDDGPAAVARFRVVFRNTSRRPQLFFANYYPYFVTATLQAEGGEISLKDARAVKMFSFAVESKADYEVLAPGESLRVMGGSVSPGPRAGTYRFELGHQMTESLRPGVYTLSVVAERKFGPIGVDLARAGGFRDVSNERYASAPLRFRVD